MPSELELDESKEEIIQEMLESNESFLIQAGPGTGKTQLICGFIKKLENQEISVDNVMILSHMNSAINTIRTKLEKYGIKYNSKNINTLMSFFFEYFLTPIGYSLYNQRSGIDGRYQSIFPLLKNSSIKEEDISYNNWQLITQIIIEYLNKDCYFDIFASMLNSNKIKLIIIDEYQDVYKDIQKILLKLINKGVKLYFIGDKNQCISYDFDLYENDLNNEYNILNKSNYLRKTYRFGDCLKEKVNSIINSHIDDCRENGGEYNQFNQIDEILEYINQNRQDFVGKTNTIIMQSTKIKFGSNQGNKRILDYTKEKAERYDNIEIGYNKSDYTNYHLKSFITNTLGFVCNNVGIIYQRDIEDHLGCFCNMNEENKKEIFKNFLSFNITSSSNFQMLINFYKYIINSGIRFKPDYFRKYNNFITEMDKLKDTEINSIYMSILGGNDIFNGIEDKIYVNINTIHSSKGDEYDNVFIVNQYKKNGVDTYTYFSKILDRSCTICGNNLECEGCYRIAKRLYYVAVSRAKKRVFTLVRYPFDEQQ